jgi:hypothetical protein
MKHFTIMAILTACTISFLAAETDGAESRREVVNRELRATVLELRSQRTATELEERVDQAMTAREEAERSLPGMAQLEDRIKATRQQLKALYRERAALLRAHAARLEALDRRLEEAEHARNAAVRDDPRVKSLIAERKALTGQLEGEE